MRHLLLFEIWEDGDSFEMSQVSERNDRVRRQIAPNAVLRHGYRAGSGFEAFQMNYDWHGWGQWRREPDWEDKPFTAEEVADQARYLAVREVR